MVLINWALVWLPAVDQNSLRDVETRAEVGFVEPRFTNVNLHVHFRGGEADFFFCSLSRFQVCIPETGQGDRRPWLRSSPYSGAFSPSVPYFLGAAALLPAALRSRTLSSECSSTIQPAANGSGPVSLCPWASIFLSFLFLF